MEKYIKEPPELSTRKSNQLMNFLGAEIYKKVFSKLKTQSKNLIGKYFKGLHKYITRKADYVYYEPTLTEAIVCEINGFKEKPLMSIVIPVFNVEKRWLEKAICSVERQWYKDWEINIVDDGSSNKETIAFLKGCTNPKVNIRFLNENKNISNASNEAIKLSNGKYLVLMDHDDELTPDALYEVVKVINNEGSEFIYSDEDKLEMDGSFSDPHFKPDYAPDAFLSTNYLSHLGVIKKVLVDKVGGFSLGMEGAQDYDLYLKVLEHTTKISHIQKVLYHWRKIPGSTASSFGEKSYANEAGRLALQAAMNRRKIKAQVNCGNSPGYYKVNYELINHPLVSIIIPFKDMPDLLRVCVESIIKKSTYKNYEIIGISNNSEERVTIDEMDLLKRLDSRIQFHEYNVPFNYSEINNYAIKKYAKGEQIILLNNDIEIITPEWIEELLMLSQRPDVGAVGAKLYFPDGTVQHGGIILDKNDVAIHTHKHISKAKGGYFNRLNIRQNFSAVTAACMMVKKKVYYEVNGLNEEELKIAYNDVDFCLRIRELGYLNIYTPYCKAYHYESVSRGFEDNPEKLERFKSEVSYMKTRHQNTLEIGDSYFNPNLVLKNGMFQFKQRSFKAFKHKIKQNIVLSSQINKYICFFSHYDKDGIIDDYVVHYLHALSLFADIIFVSTAENMNASEIVKIKKLCIQVVIKENYGYDFGAWKTALELSHVELSNYECLIMCNDSVYGPLYDLKDILKAAMNKYDVFSITDSYEQAHHLQSYFVVYSKTAFSHELFKEFWNNFVIYESKELLIQENEVKYSGSLINSELSVSSLCKAESGNKLNQLHFFWDRLILDQRCPFIKIELLRDNPRNMNLNSWKKVIKATDHPIPVKYIDNHLCRM